jgi:hypothetical protein
LVPHWTGKNSGMARPPVWSIEYRLREDEDSLFVPAELLPRAQPGDAVEISSAQPLLTRRGRVTDRVNDEARGEFVTVDLD